MPRKGPDEAIWVYFIQAHMSVPGLDAFPGHVKIGKAVDLIRRYVTFQAYTSPEVSLLPLGFVHADDYSEEDLHLRWFSGLRHRSSEWFRPDTLLLTFIQDNAEEFPELNKWGRPTDLRGWERRLHRLQDPAERKANQHLGADVNAADKYGETALHRATRRGSISKIRYLLERGADVNATRGPGGMTPLHYAAWRGREGALDVVRYLVEHGAQVNAAVNGATPVHTAASGWGRLDIVRYLVEHGADVEAADHAGYTALQCAHRNETRALLRELGAKEP